MECKLSSIIWWNKIDYREDACMKFYDEEKPLYLETDASDVQLGADLL